MHLVVTRAVLVTLFALLATVACSGDPTAPRRRVTLRFCFDLKAVAVQNEGGDWRLVGSGRSVTFDATEKIGLAVAEENGSPPLVSVFISYVTAEQAEKRFNCPTPGGDPGNVTVHASVAGLGANEYAGVASPGLNMLRVPATFDLCCLAPKPIDIIAWKELQSPGAVLPTIQSMIVRRDQNPPHGTTLAAFDFGSAEAFIPSTHMLTFAGAPAGAVIWAQTYLRTATNTEVWTSVDSTSGTTLSYRAVPERYLVASDLQYVLSSTGSRSMVSVFHAPADRTITFGAPLATPVFANAAGSASRPHVEIPFQADYPAQVRFSIIASDGHVVDMHMTREFRGAARASWSLTAPDLGHIPEIGNSWWITGQYQWVAYASGQPLGWTVTDAHDGDSFATAHLTGSKP